MGAQRRRHAMKWMASRKKNIRGGRGGSCTVLPIWGPSERKLMLAYSERCVCEHSWLLLAEQRRKLHGVGCLQATAAGNLAVAMPGSVQGRSPGTCCSCCCAMPAVWATRWRSAWPTPPPSCRAPRGLSGTAVRWRRPAGRLQAEQGGGGGGRLWVATARRPESGPDAAA